MDLIPPLYVSAYLLLFAGLALAIRFEGTILSQLADAIGDKTGVDQALMGLIYLAPITELVTKVAAPNAGNAVMRRPTPQRRSSIPHSPFRGRWR